MKQNGIGTIIVKPKFKVTPLLCFACGRRGHDKFTCYISQKTCTKRRNSR